MTLPVAAFEKIARDVVGLPLNYIWQGFGTALFLEFGDLKQQVRKDGSAAHPQGEISVGLEFDWRIERAGRVICGSHGELALWPTVFEGLKGKRATRLEVRGEIQELLVELDEVERLLTFALKEDGPQWAVTDNRTDPRTWVYWKDRRLVCNDGNVPP